MFVHGSEYFGRDGLDDRRLSVEALTGCTNPPVKPGGFSLIKNFP